MIAADKGLFSPGVRAPAARLANWEGAGAGTMAGRLQQTGVRRARGKRGFLIGGCRWRDRPALPLSPARGGGVPGRQASGASPRTKSCLLPAPTRPASQQTLTPSAPGGGQWGDSVRWDPLQGGQAPPPPHSPLDPPRAGGEGLGPLQSGMRVWEATAPPPNRFVIGASWQPNPLSYPAPASHRLHTEVYSPGLKIQPSPG